MDRGAWRAAVHGVSSELDTTEATWHVHACIHVYLFFFFFFWPRCVACNILVP